MSQHILRSRVTHLSAVEYDLFSQQEEETSNSVPSDVSITRLHDNRVFPSKQTMMPHLMNSLQKPKTKYRVQRSLSESDEIIRKREEHYSQAFRALRTTIKAYGNIKSDHPLGFRRVQTEGDAVRTISLKIPNLSDSKDRSTEYNVVERQDDIDDDFSIEHGNEEFAEEEEAVSETQNRLQRAQTLGANKKIYIKKDRVSKFSSESSSNLKPRKTDSEDLKPQANKCSIF